MVESSFQGKNDSCHDIRALRNEDITIAHNGVKMFGKGVSFVCCYKPL